MTVPGEGYFINVCIVLTKLDIYILNWHRTKGKVRANRFVCTSVVALYFHMCCLSTNVLPFILVLKLLTNIITCITFFLLLLHLAHCLCFIAYWFGFFNSWPFCYSMLHSLVFRSLLTNGICINVLISWIVIISLSFICLL